MPTFRTFSILSLLIASRLAAQPATSPAGADAKAQGTPAVLACPSADQPAQDPITFTWKPGTQTATYRLLLGPTAGASRDGDSAIISGLQAKLAGLPRGQSLYVTLWSYDASGKPVEPPSFCFLKTAPGNGAIAYQDLAGTSFSGVSLGSVALGPAPGDRAAAARGCQQQCNLNAACQGYTYFPAANGNAAAMCDLKSEITASFRNECCVSARKGAGPNDAAPDKAAPDRTAKETATPAALPPAPPAVATPVATQAAALPDPFTPRSASTTAPSPAPAPLAPSAPAPPPPPPPPPTPAAPRVAVAAAPVPPAARATPTAVAPATGLSGDWVNQLGAVSRLVQQGAAVSGAYSDASQPSLSGAFEGTFDGKTLRATLTWKSGPDSSHGALLLILTSDGRLDGTWTDANGVSGPWIMARRP